MAAKKLRRSHANRMLAGVCSGISQYFGLNVNIVRLATVALTLVSLSAGAFIYFALWLVLADDQTGDLGADKVADLYAQYRKR
ncbi:MAG: PspC domain-containing protein [Propionibacteriaceae bacterium]|jgi:phage shock protein PspC (stress-responsive transcriptional regulator)|nr:PspC domain-containing protein [Propionibacteriaceae bacterium]